MGDKVRWIAYSKQPPEEYQYVLVSGLGRGPSANIQILRLCEGSWEFRSGELYSETEHGYITHWMPLPKPPGGIQVPFIPSRK